MIWLAQNGPLEADIRHNLCELFSEVIKPTGEQVEGFGFWSNNRTKSTFLFLRKKDQL